MTKPKRFYYVWRSNKTLEFVTESRNRVQQYIIEKTGESKVIEYVAYNGNVSESVQIIDFKTYCKNLIKNYTHA